MSGEIENAGLPKHIAIIMDGNGRWAKKRGLPRVMGHKAGMNAIKETVRACSDLGIKILTVYAFSTENWKRPQDEVSYLMNLLVEYLHKEIRELHSNNVKIKILGDIDVLPEQTRKEIREALKLTENNKGLQFNIALNYGGRVEIINACKSLIKLAKEGVYEAEQINEELFSKYLYTGGDIDPDLIIRTSGEQRLSNFLLWQCAYSEFVFIDELWPDFNKDTLISAIKKFQDRDRRFGALK
jgi:undecaprenyl diphosphate synthase